jgi:transposase-like protein
MTMTSESERLRRAISRRYCPNSRLSAELRAEASAHASRRSSQGATQSEIAAELGVSMVSVGRWLREGRDPHESTALVPVSIIADVVDNSSTYEVVTPRGFRVVRLDMRALCMLLERLG